MTSEKNSILVYFLDFVNFNSDLNKEYLADRGVDALYFDDIQSFYQMAAITPPIVIIHNMDLRKDDQTWFFDLRKRFNDIPIILLSSSKTLSKARKLLDKGAFMNVRSPINMEELYHMIKRAIEFKNKGSKSVETGQETSL